MTNARARLAAMAKDRPTSSPPARPLLLEAMDRAEWTTCDLWSRMAHAAPARRLALEDPYSVAGSPTMRMMEAGGNSQADG